MLSCLLAAAHLDWLLLTALCATLKNGILALKRRSHVCQLFQGQSYLIWVLDVQIGAPTQQWDMPLAKLLQTRLLHRAVLALALAQQSAALWARLLQPKVA